MSYTVVKTLIYPKPNKPVKKTRWSVSFCAKVDGKIDYFDYDYRTKKGALFSIWFWCVFKKWLTCEGAINATLIERVPLSSSKGS